MGTPSSTTGLLPPAIVELLAENFDKELEAEIQNAKNTVELHGEQTALEADISAKKNRKRLLYFLAMLGILTVLSGGLIAVTTFTYFDTLSTLSLWQEIFYSVLFGGGVASASTAAWVSEFKVSIEEENLTVEEKKKAAEKQKILDFLKLAVYSLVSATPVLLAFIGYASNVFLPLVMFQTWLAGFAVIGTVGAALIAPLPVLIICVPMVIIIAVVQNRAEEKVKLAEAEVIAAIKAEHKRQRILEDLKFYKQLIERRPELRTAENFNAAKEGRLDKALFPKVFSASGNRKFDYNLLKEYNKLIQESEERKRAEALLSPRLSVIASIASSGVMGTVFALGVSAFLISLAIGLGATGIGLVIVVPVVVGIVCGGLIGSQFAYASLLDSQKNSAELARHYGLSFTPMPLRKMSPSSKLMRGMNWIVEHPALTMALVLTLTILASPVMGWPAAVAIGTVLMGVVIAATFYQKWREKQINVLIAEDKTKRKEAKHEYLKKRRSDLNMGASQRPAPLEKGAPPPPPPVESKGPDKGSLSGGKTGLSPTTASEPSLSSTGTAVVGPSVQVAVAVSTLAVPVPAAALTPATVVGAAPAPVATAGSTTAAQQPSATSAPRPATPIPPSGTNNIEERIAAATPKQETEAAQHQANIDNMAGRNFAWDYKEALYRLFSRNEDGLNRETKSVLYDTLDAFGKIKADLPHEEDFIQLFFKKCSKDDFQKEFSELLGKHSTQVSEFNWLREKEQLILVERLQKAINPEKQKSEEKVVLMQPQREKTPMEKIQRHGIISHQEKEHSEGKKLLETEHPKDVSVKD